MTKVRYQSKYLSRFRFSLAPDEFVSLKAVGKRPLQYTIPNAHRDRLIAAGYVREMTGRWNDISTLVLTGAGIRRLESGE